MTDKRTIEKICQELETSNNPKDVFAKVPVPIRNAFLYGAVTCDQDAPKKALAKKIQGALTCSGIPIGTQIVSWNVDSLRAGIVDAETAACKRKERPITPESPMGQLIAKYDPDVICLQETKIQTANAECFSPNGYFTTWNSSEGRKGYSGVAVWSKEKPLRVETELPGIPDHLQEEGRILTVYFEGYILVNTYVPNTLRGGTKPVGGWDSVREGGKASREERQEAYERHVGGRMQWDKAILAHLEELREENPNVIWCGDLNVARTLFDIHNGHMTQKKYEQAERNQIAPSRVKDLKNRVRDGVNMDKQGGGAGYRLEEREGLENVLSHGFFDAYREIYPAPAPYDPDGFEDKYEEPASQDEYGFTFWDRTKVAYRSTGNGWRIDYFILSDALRLCVRGMRVLKDLGVEGNKVPSDHAPLLIQF